MAISASMAWAYPACTRARVLARNTLSSSLSERTNEVGQERDYRVRFVHYRGAGRLWRPPTHPRWVRKRYFNHLSDRLLEQDHNGDTYAPERSNPSQPIDHIRSTSWMCCGGSPE